MSSVEQEIVNEEPVGSESQSSEDKFFGVTTEISSSPAEQVEIEIIDDVPEEEKRPKKSKDSSASSNEEIDAEISNYSKRAGDRINELTYQYNEEKRSKGQAERVSVEAAERVKSLLADNQRLEQMVSQGGQVLNKTAYNNALWAKHSATQDYKKAYEEGDADAMAKAQELLSKATLAEQQSGSTAQNVHSQILQNMPVQPQIPEQQVQRKPDPDMEKWARKNPWFMGEEPFQKQMTAYSLFIDQNLVAKGVDPKTKADDYYSEVDSAMRKQFPEFFGVQNDSNSGMVVNGGSLKPQPQTVVASATRDSGNKKPTQIRLTKTQVAFARQLGISPEKYANQLLKES
jgi:hypothetical protein